MMKLKFITNDYNNTKFYVKCAQNNEGIEDKSVAGIRKGYKRVAILLQFEYNEFKLVTKL